MAQMTFWLSIALGLLATTSCSPKVFSTNDSLVETNETPTSGGGGGSGTIVCGPLLNELTTSLVLNTSDSNPTLKSHCIPESVTNTWSVMRSSTPVTINGLSGSSSTPDFLSAGAGTYFIGLDASAMGLTGFSLSSPLQVVVRNDIAGNPDIVCAPKLNDTLTAYTATNADPTVSANCTPPGVSYVWTVYKGGTPIVVPGLTGSSSTGSFISLGEGVYQIWVAASQSGYNTYYSTTPLTVTVPKGATAQHAIHETQTISSSANKLDILLVVDDSSSMLADNQRLASRLQGFVNSLASNGLDWQACVTLTRAQRVSSADPLYYWGASVNWSGVGGATPWILNQATPNTYQVFTQTINAIGAGWAGTDDERGIKAAWWHLWNGEPGVTNSSGCYRPDAGLAVLILSDEDERSIGGDQTQVYYSSEANKPLENDDLAQTYVDYVHEVFGSSKRLTVNSIIVRPGDTTCAANQDAEGSKSHYGVKYNELSQLTSGHVGSICDSDYTSTLTDITKTITETQASVPLKCTPVNGVTIVVSPNYTYTSNINGDRLYFSPALPIGSTVTLDYTCP